MLIHSLKCDTLRLGPTVKIPSHLDIVEPTCTCVLYSCLCVAARAGACVCVCVCATVLLNNTSFTRQNFKAQRTLRKGGKRKRGREERVGGLEGETKTKIQDEQWWEGQRRSDGWLSDSSQWLPVMLNTFCVRLTVCLPACPQPSVSVFWQWYTANILKQSSFIFVMFLFFRTSFTVICSSWSTNHVLWSLFLSLTAVFTTEMLTCSLVKTQWIMHSE